MTEKQKRPLYERALEAGQKAAVRKEPGRDAIGAFYCWAAGQPEFVGLEAAWRRFAVGYDPANKAWAESDI
jgi:hypothetical protein